MTDTRWKRSIAVSEAMRRLEAAAQLQDFSQLDYRDVALVVGELDHHHGRGYVTLQLAYRAVHSMARERHPESIAALDLVQGYQEYAAWEQEFFDLLLGRASETIASPFYRGHGRVHCPLCGEGPEQMHAAQGFLVPEGLRRHLTGYGHMNQCTVMVVLRENSQQSWRK